jgi:hypothetical protein
VVTVVAGKEVAGMVPPGLVGVVVQPAIITSETNTRERQKVVMINVGLDIVIHPVSLVDSFRPV